MTETPSPDHSHYRLSDDDRERVVELVNDAYVDGRLDQAERDERVDQVMEALRYADLDPILADLVVQSPWDVLHPPSPVHSTPATGVIEPAGAAIAEDTIRATFSDVKRKGPLVLARHTVIRAKFGSVSLDVRQARFFGNECHVEVHCFFGDVKIRVPEGVQIVDRIDSIMSSTKVKGVGPASEAFLTLSLSGRCLFGDVKVIGPQGRHWRQWLAVPGDQN